MVATEFGRAVRDARDATRETLKTMAAATGKSAAFLSALETGRSKIPLDFVEVIVDFFHGKQYTFAKNLMDLAQIQNGRIVLSDELPIQQKMLIAFLARSRLNKSELDQLSRFFQELCKAGEQGEHETNNKGQNVQSGQIGALT